MSPLRKRRGLIAHNIYSLEKHLRSVRKQIIILRLSSDLSCLVLNFSRYRLGSLYLVSRNNDDFILLLLIRT